MMRMGWREKYRELAKKALSKPPVYGEDIDIFQFTPKEAKSDIDLHAISDILKVLV